MKQSSFIWFIVPFVVFLEEKFLAITRRHDARYQNKQLASDGKKTIKHAEISY